MRTVVLAAALASALSLARPAPAAAQDPPPPPPATPDRAVPRSERPAARTGDSRGGEARAAAAAERAAARAEQRGTEVRGAARRPDPAAENPEGRNERAPRAAPEARLDAPSPPPVNDSAVSEDGQRSGAPRGAVRRPPSGGTSRGDSPRGEIGSVDRAVPRSSVPRPSARVYAIPNYYGNGYYRYYDPWGFGAFGLGYFYYSPWGWNPGYYGPPYGYAAPGYGGYDIGKVKLKVKPRDAEVYVDGYFAGHVDDFDGALQALKLDSGAYTIEVRKPGFETLRFDVRVQPERSITFRGEMKPVP